MAKKKAKKSIAKGVVYVAATFNNTVITVTDEMGNVISWSSAGALGFKGSKKSTPYAAQQAVDDALTKAKENGTCICINAWEKSSGWVVKKNNENDVIKLNNLKTIETARENEINNVSIMMIIIISNNKPLIVVNQCLNDLAIINNGMVEINIIINGMISEKNSDNNEITIA